MKILERIKQKIPRLKEKDYASGVNHSKNYVSFVRGPHKPIFVTEDKKDEYRSMRKLDALRKAIGALAIVLIVIFGYMAVTQYVIPKLRPIAETSLPQSASDDGEESTSQAEETVSVTYDKATGLPIYDDDFNLFVINGSNPVDESFTVKTQSFMGIEVDERITDALRSMVNAAEAAGASMTFSKGYISWEDQSEQYDAEVNKLRKNGYTNLMAQYTAKQTVSYPGQSDSQTGMSVTIDADSSTFTESNVYSWLNNHAAEYGFVFRYPEGKKDYTGNEGDYTVLRYVGGDNALKMRQLSMCLEEYRNYIFSR